MYIIMHLESAIEWPGRRAWNQVLTHFSELLAYLALAARLLLLYRKCCAAAITYIAADGYIVVWKHVGGWGIKESSNKKFK